MLEKIQNAKTREDLTACLEIIEGLEWNAQMCDNLRNSERELADCRQYRKAIQQQAKALSIEL